MIKDQNLEVQETDERKLEVKAEDFMIEEISEMPMALRQWGNSGPGPTTLANE